MKEAVKVILLATEGVGVRYADNVVAWGVEGGESGVMDRT
jgi:hypothetical protein